MDYDVAFQTSHSIAQPPRNIADRMQTVILYVEAGEHLSHISLDWASIKISAKTGGDFPLVELSA
jgi:hypothetical protein